MMISQAESLERFFNPNSVAIVGASRNPDKIGYELVRNLKEGGFNGLIYPVNPGAQRILGFKCYKSILDIPDEVDIAVLAIPAKYTPEAAEECGKKGVKGIIVIASGFSEVGNNDLEEQLAKVVRKYGMRLLGPNVVGLMNNNIRMNASFAPYLPYPGKIGMVSQSGAMIVALDARTWIDRIGMSFLISIGNMADLSFSDVVRFLEGDKNTVCISLYVEGLNDGKRFIEVARKSRKPIVMLKSGTSKQGLIAAASHTGSLAGSDKVYDGALRQCGVIRADTIDDLFDKSLVLSIQPTMKGQHALVITNGGGIGVLATDAAEKYELPLESPPEDLSKILKGYMPEFGSVRNPIDLTAMANTVSYQDSVREALKNDWVDGLVVLYCEVATLDPQVAAKGILRGVIEADTDKPVSVAMVGGEHTKNASDWLQKNGIPAFPSPERAVNALATLRTHEILNTLLCSTLSEPRNMNRDEARNIIAKAKKSGLKILSEKDSKDVLANYGIEVNKTVLARSERELIERSGEFRFPVALKIQSPDITHKFDVGGVKLDIRNERELGEAYREMITVVKRNRPDAKIDGVVIEEMLQPGLEVIIGSINDPTFGPSVMFGLGGITVEVMSDVSFRVAPICYEDAQAMIFETMAGKLMGEIRGKKRKDINKLIDTIVRFSWLAHDFPEIREIDANPVMVYEYGIIAVDARIILE